MSKKQKKESLKVQINRKKILIIFISAFLGAALLFGAILGVISIVKSSGAIYSYSGITMNEKVASFFVGRFKTQYIHDLRTSGYEAQNTENFWNSKYEDGRTHGEIMREFAEVRLKQIIVNNYLFDRYSSLSSSDKKKIEKAINETLDYQAEGSIEKFNGMAAEYGFDYSSYCDAVEMLYKSDSAFSAIYGSDGSAISSDSALCKDYLSEYSHVSLIFIRTNDKLVSEDNGNLKVEALTESERVARLESIEKIRAAILAFNEGSDGMMTPSAFNSYLASYGEGDSDYDATGYYFHEDSEFTSEFSEQFPEVTEKALSMSTDSYAEVSVDFSYSNENGEIISSPGVCFIYKSAPVSDAYYTSSLERCFSDFYADASVSLYLKTTEVLMGDVEAGKKLQNLDFIKIATNSILYPRYDAQ